MPLVITRFLGGPLDGGAMPLPERPEPNSEFDLTRDGREYRYQWQETKLAGFWEFVAEITAEATLDRDS